MASYSIRWKKSAQKEFRNLQTKERIAILAAVEALAENPRKQGVKKLVGSDYSYRVRVGNYRIVYEIIDQVLTIEIIRVRHRKSVYE
jgi:mRNA interferase RelE/StbE